MPFVVAGVAFAVAVLAAILLVQANSTDPGSSRAAEPDAPVVATARDANFGLTLTTPRGTFRPGDLIEPVASVTYLGPRGIEMIYHATDPIQFHDRRGRRRTVDGWRIRHALPVHGPGQRRVDDDEVQQVRRADPTTADRGLQSGVVQGRGPLCRRGRGGSLRASQSSTGDCGGPAHSLTVENVIRVLGDDP